MISYHLTVDDLADMRFACSPLVETVTSLWALRWPERYVLHLPWIRATRAAIAGMEQPLNSLIGAERGWLPDFLAPRPHTPLPDIEDELTEVRVTDPAKAEADFRAVYGDHPLPTVTDPIAIAAVVERYWRVAIEPYWPRMRALLEADMLYRSRLLAREGAATMLTDLDHRARWESGILRLHTGQSLEYDVAVAGRGLWLIPALFVPQTVSPVGPDEPPAIAYPARGIATLWEADPPQADEALAELIGIPKARLLSALEGPASTTELARRLGVTASAISQHLAVLRRSRLVSTARVGRVVLYGRTDLADRLMGQSSPRRAA